MREHEAALALAQQSGGEMSGVYITRLRYRGVSFLNRGRLQEAERDLDRALALAALLPSNAAAESDKVCAVLARLRNLQNRPVEAEALLRQVLRTGNTMTRSVQMSVRTELATSLSLQGRKEEAARLFPEVIADHQGSFGVDGAPLVSPLIAAAAHFRRSGDPDSAIRYAQYASRIAHATQPAGSWLGALAAAELAFSLRAADREAEARPFAESAYAVLAATLGANDARSVALARLLNP
jgi:tetratricopeptide (TPR) repeat protein